MSSTGGAQLVRLTRILALGPVSAQLIVLAASPLLTRLYVPAVFAEIAAFLLVGGALASIACLKLDNAIIKERSSNNAAQSAFVALAAVVAISAFAGAVALIAARIFEHAMLAWVALLLPAYLLAGGVYDILNALALRRHFAVIVTRGRLVLVTASVAAQIALGTWRGETTSFVFGLVLGYMATVAYLVHALRIRSLRLTSLARVRLVLARHRSDTTHGSPSALLFTVGNNIAPVVLTATAGPLIGGFFALLQRVAFNPVLILTTLLSQSLLPWLAKNRSDAANATVLRLSTRLAWVALAMSVLMLPLSEPLFSVVFGETWREAGAIGAVLFLALPGRLAFEVLANLSIIENRQTSLLAVRSFSLVAALFVLVFFCAENPGRSFLLYAAVQSVIALCGCWIVGRSVRGSLRTELAPVTFGVACAFAVAILLEFIPAASENRAWMLTLLLLGTGLLVWSSSRIVQLWRRLGSDARSDS